MTILLTYMIAAYTSVRLGQMRSPLREKFWRTLQLSGCAVVGALASLPVYLDPDRDGARLGQAEWRARQLFSCGLAAASRDSGNSRIRGHDFDWSWLGNAISPAFPEPFNGLSFTPSSEV